MERTVGTARPLISLTVAVGPPVVWSVHLLICYLLVYMTGDLGNTTVRVELSFATLLALALIGATALVGWRSFRLAPLEDGEAFSFLDEFGVWSAAVFGLATIFTAAPIYFLEQVAV